MAVTEANAAIVGGDFADIVDGPALVSGEGDEAVDEVIATDDLDISDSVKKMIFQTNAETVFKL